MATGPHDDFLELCALSTSDDLTAAEREKLANHLAVCSSCREAKGEFESVVDHVIPAIGAAENRDAPDQDSYWSLKDAEGKLLRRLRLEEARSDLRQERPSGETFGALPTAATDTAWHHLWMLYAASVLLVISLGVVSYRFGTHRGSSLNQRAALRSVAGRQVATSDSTLLQEQLSDFSHERELARVEIVRRDRLITELRSQLEQRSKELAQVRLAQATPPQPAVPKDGQDFSVERAELAQSLEASEQQVNALRNRLDLLQHESFQAQAKMAGLESKIADLTRALEERQGQVAQQQQLLAHDRDIRELMGARDLYISEVYDVARSGETQKAFGRVFYTKEKSLIFYAYDLDEEKGVRNASTFQAWGRRGPDRSQALNLGVFYQDNAAKKRWVLKFNDPKTLAQIDAVFVTIEPDGGSRKPSGKPLLFAYLKMDPNHP